MSEPFRVIQGCGIFLGDALGVLREMPSNHYQAVVTSPPYWRLRAYGTNPQIWGGRANCRHEWVSHRYYTEKSVGGKSGDAFSEAGEANAQRLKDARWREDDTCSKCGAWRGELGLEPTIATYLDESVVYLMTCAKVDRSTAMEIAVDILRLPLEGEE